MTTREMSGPRRAENGDGGRMDYEDQNPPTGWYRGQQVICNGFPGTIREVCAGQLAGMLVVRLERGEVCVSGNCPLTVQPA